VIFFPEWGRIENLRKKSFETGVENLLGKVLQNESRKNQRNVVLQGSQRKSSRKQIAQMVSKQSPQILQYVQMYTRFVSRTLLRYLLEACMRTITSQFFLASEIFQGRSVQDSTGSSSNSFLLPEASSLTSSCLSLVQVGVDSRPVLRAAQQVFQTGKGVEKVSPGPSPDRPCSIKVDYILAQCAAVPETLLKTRKACNFPIYLPLLCVLRRCILSRSSVPFQSKSFVAQQKTRYRTELDPRKSCSY
jgi:hypothetical protein